MKKYFFIAIICLQVVYSLAQSRNDKEPFTTKSLATSSIKEVTAETSGGNISVTGGAADPRIEVYIRQNNNGGELSKDEIQKKLDEDYNLNVSVENNKLTAVARPKKQNMNWKKALSISFRIFVPENTSTDLSTSGGNIDLQKVSGKQRFSTSGGNLQIDEVSGGMRGRTSGGNIHLSNSKDEIDLQTSGEMFMQATVPAISRSKPQEVR